MKIWLVPLAAFWLGVGGTAAAQECTHLWGKALETDPLRPKYYSGDTSAAYAVLSFWGDPRLKLEFRGKFPRARFLSYETQWTRLSISEDAIFDYQIEPDRGSTNPFAEGGDPEAVERNHTIVATQGGQPGLANSIALPQGYLAQSVMLRIYAPPPSPGITAADLPRVFAFDKQNGEPRKCPRPAAYASKFPFPQFLADLYTKFAPFEFKTPGETSLLGLNKAAGYMYAVAPMSTRSVFLFRFRAPTRDQVRYWSFCLNNFPKNQTLACTPDSLAPPHVDGMAYIAVGRGEAVKREAVTRGYAFLPDARKASQHVMGFVYRNLVPDPIFKTGEMYKGSYVPEAIECDADTFVSGHCGW